MKAITSILILSLLTPACFAETWNVNLKGTNFKNSTGQVVNFSGTGTITTTKTLTGVEVRFVFQNCSLGLSSICKYEDGVFTGTGGLNGFEATNTDPTFRDDIVGYVDANGVMSGTLRIVDTYVGAESDSTYVRYSTGAISTMPQFDAAPLFVEAQRLLFLPSITVGNTDFQVLLEANTNLQFSVKWALKN